MTELSELKLFMEEIRTEISHLRNLVVENKKNSPQPQSWSVHDIPKVVQFAHDFPSFSRHFQEYVRSTGLEWTLNVTDETWYHDPLMKDIEGQMASMFEKYIVPVDIKKELADLSTAAQKWQKLQSLYREKIIKEVENMSISENENKKNNEDPLFLATKKLQNLSLNTQRMTPQKPKAQQNNQKFPSSKTKTKVLKTCMLLDIDHTVAVCLNTFKSGHHETIERYIEERRNKDIFTATEKGATYVYSIRPNTRQILKILQSHDTKIIIATKARRIIAEAFISAVGLNKKDTMMFTADTFLCDFKSFKDFEHSKEGRFDPDQYDCVYILDDTPINFLIDLAQTHVKSIPVMKYTKETAGRDRLFYDMQPLFQHLA